MQIRYSFSDNCNFWARVVATNSQYKVLVFSSYFAALSNDDSLSIANGSSSRYLGTIDIVETNYPHRVFGKINFTDQIINGTTIIKLICEELSTSSSSSLDSSSTSSSSLMYSLFSSRSSRSSASTSSTSGYADLSSLSSRSSFSSLSSSSLDSSSSSSLFDAGICLDGRDNVTIQIEEDLFIFKNYSGNSAIWDYGRVGEHLFTFFGESITRIINYNTYTITYIDLIPKCVLIQKTDDASSSSKSSYSSSSKSSYSSSSSLSSLHISSSSYSTFTSISSYSDFSSFSSSLSSLSESSISFSSISSYEKKLISFRYRFSGMQLPKITLGDGFEYDYIPVNTYFTHQPEYYSKPFYYGTVTDRIPQSEMLKAEQNQSFVTQKGQQPSKHTKTKNLFNLLPLSKPSWLKKS